MVFMPSILSQTLCAGAVDIVTFDLAHRRLVVIVAEAASATARVAHQMTTTATNAFLVPLFPFWDVTVRALAVSGLSD
jgi:hypothetical protein